MSAMSWLSVGAGAVPRYPPDRQDLRAGGKDQRAASAACSSQWDAAAAITQSTKAAITAAIRTAAGAGASSHHP
jgi:hypothetical protein